MDMLLRYGWPGNVRELENAIERAVILSAGDYITEREFPLSIVSDYSGGQNAFPASSREEDMRSLEAVEKRAVLDALAASRGNKSRAARMLGINRKTLYKKLKTYGVG
jgi:two-component system response regulator HydG